MSSPRYLTIDKCPHGTFAVAIYSNHSGTRLTPTKCCGRWDRVHAWELSAQQLREIANEIECEADQMDRT